MGHGTSLGLLVASALVGGSLLAAGSVPTGSSAKELPPPVQWFGPDSEIRESRWVRVREAEAWRELWGEHRGQRATRAVQGWVLPPEIDFQRYEVLALFRGESINNNGERASLVIDQGEHTLVRFDSVTFQTMSLEGPDHGERTVPYGIWVIERTEGPIVVQENVQGLIGEEPIWREVRRFEAAG